MEFNLFLNIFFPTDRFYDENFKKNMSNQKIYYHRALQHNNLSPHVFLHKPGELSANARELKYTVLIFYF